jgi:hypothetical protein
MASNQAGIERQKTEIKSILERVRGAIRTRVHPRDQAQMLDSVDRIQDVVLTALDPNSIGTNLLRGKDCTRKILRSKPVDMVQILNELDGLESEVVKLLAMINK